MGRSVVALPFKIKNWNLLDLSSGRRGWNVCWLHFSAQLVDLGSVESRRKFLAREAFDIQSLISEMEPFLHSLAQR